MHEVKCFSSLCQHIFGFMNPQLFRSFITDVPFSIWMVVLFIFEIYHIRSGTKNYFRLSQSRIIFSD